ncbi:unnamed protein product, partial [Staurois parvus]
MSAWKCFPSKTQHTVKQTQHTVNPLITSHVNPLPAQVLLPPSCPGQFSAFSTHTLNDNCTVMQHCTQTKMSSFSS